MNCRLLTGLMLFLLTSFYNTYDLYGQTYLRFQSATGQTISNERLKDLSGFPHFYKVGYAYKLKGKPYHEAFNNPLCGFSLSYINHNNDITGRSLSLSGYLEPTIWHRKRHTISWRLSIGMSKVEKPFHPIDNPDQIGIGSSFNLFGELQFLYLFQITDQSSIDLFGGISHISNGAMRRPNAGLNVLHLGIGTTYKLSSESKYFAKWFNEEEMEREPKKITHHIVFRYGLNSIQSRDYKRYPAYGMNYTSAVNYSTIGSYTVGLDVDYNQGYIEGHKAFNEWREDEVEFRRLRWAAVVGHEFHLNKLTVLTQCAVYLFRPDDNHPLVYQRYGFRYPIHDNVNIAATLRAHNGRADYLEWTAGFMF